MSHATVYGAFLVRLIVLVPWVVRLLAQESWSTAPFNPFALSLAVRSPYLNVWLEQGPNPQRLNGAFPDFWDSRGVFGWYSSVVVDDIPYKLLAETNVPPIDLANQTAVEFTATRSSFIFTAGPMQINMSFISPIEPTDLVRQSIPFSYITMSATATDGNAHDVRMFINTNGELITGDVSLVAEWDAEDDGEYTLLSMQLRDDKSSFSEISHHAQDAVHYFCLKKISGASTSWAITNNNDNHAFAANGTLAGQIDSNFRPVSQDWPTLGLAFDWESISETPEPAVWAVGLVRNPTIQYHAPDGGVQERYPYFLSTYDDGPSAARAFLDDFPRAQAEAAEFNSIIESEGRQYSQEYANLLHLGVLHLMGSMDITLSRSGGGEWNTSDVKVFMKNLGGVGSDALSGTLSVNTVDTLYAILPGLLYLNPELVGYLLSPLLEYQDSSAYTLDYAARNIGTSFPNATADGINSPHSYGVEESANMLIMTLAYSQRSGNGTFLSRHYTLLRGWAVYLEENSMTPTDQRSSDSTFSSFYPNINQTNTAIKGIIGISCMAKIAEIAGVSDDQERFSNTAEGYLSYWLENAVAEDNSHISFIYGEPTTHGLIYNLYADKLLQLDLVPDSVYDVLTSYYDRTGSTSQYGIPLNDQDSGRTTTHWMMFAASTVTRPETRNSMISQVHAYAASNSTEAPFPAVYNPSSGAPLDVGELGAGYGSPVTGAFFSLLALNTTIHSSISLPSEGSTIPSGGSPGGSSTSKTNIGAIVGGTLGGLAVILVILAGVWLWLRRRRRLRKERDRMRSVPILSSEFRDSASLQIPQSMPSTTANISRPSEKQRLVVNTEKRRPIERAEQTGESDMEPVTSSSRPSANPGNADANREALTTVFRGVQDDREYLSQELENIRREMEMLRNEHINEAPPSYSGSSVGRFG